MTNTVSRTNKVNTTSNTEYPERRDGESSGWRSWLGLDDSKKDDDREYNYSRTMTYRTEPSDSTRDYRGTGETYTRGYQPTRPYMPESPMTRPYSTYTSEYTRPYGPEPSRPYGTDTMPTYRPYTSTYTPEYTRPYGPEPRPYGPEPRPYGPEPRPYGPEPRPYGVDTMMPPRPYGPEPRPYGPEPRPYGMDSMMPPRPYTTSMCTPEYTRPYGPEPRPTYTGAGYGYEPSYPRPTPCPPMTGCERPMSVPAYPSTSRGYGYPSESTWTRPTTYGSTYPERDTYTSTRDYPTTYPTTGRDYPITPRF